MTIVPPFFWDTSGRATIHGFVTTSMKLYGEQIFLKMHEDPAFVLVLHDWIADVYINLVRHYSELGDMPVTSVHIGECSGTMISGEQYDQFVLPYINKVADVLGPIRLHSCGRSDHLLASMSNIQKLQALDTGSHTSVKAVRQQLGPELQLDLAPPLEALREDAPPETMKAWLDEVLAENGDAPMLLGYHLEPGYSLPNCLLVHDELAQRGLIEPEGRPMTWAS
jgi:uroporphyrinogen-III decarboxylase